MYFHTDNPDIITALAAAMDRAQAQGKIRLDVSSDGTLRVKVGGGMWSAPIQSTEDPWRDQR